MNFFKRALVSISRKKGKSLLLFAIIFILGNVIAGAVSISQATNNVEKTVKDQLGAQATIDMSEETMEKLFKDSNEDTEFPEPPSVDVIKKVGALDSVKYYDYNIEDYYTSEKVKAVIPKDEEENAEDMGNSFQAKGVEYANLLDVEENKIKLDAGSVFTKEQVADGKNVIIMSSQVAKLNNISVGDNFVLDNVYTSYDDKTDKEKKLFTHVNSFKVVGLFTPTKIESKKKLSNDKKMEQEWVTNELINTFYLPNKTVSRMNQAYVKESFEKDTTMADGMSEKELADYKKGASQEAYSSTFVIKKPEQMPDFVADATPLLPKYYSIISAQDKYDTISGSMNKVAKFSKYILITAAAASIIILTLVIILFIRDRKKELGIYLSLGEKKIKIIGQIFIEVLIVAFIAISISLFTGNLLAKNVSTSLISNDTKTEQDSGMISGNQIGNANADIDFDTVKDSYTVKIDGPYIAFFYLIGLVTVILSTALPMLYILRLNPKKIMM